MFSPSTPREYRILGSSWFGAVGHIAMLDYYLKYKRLYGQENCRVVSTASTGLDCSNFLSRKFADMGIHFIHPSELEADYNKWADKHGAPQWQALLPQERAALIDDFWEHDFPDGEILSYTHAAARIQKEWEEAGNDPLLKVSENERKWLSQYLEVIGLPKNAWYVCLHVREGGYHKDWNAKYPSMRDCEIEDYYSSIHAITEAGGWVIRMGDSSMKKLPPMENVVDYAHCNVKQPAADVLIAASCRFFLGTNSGFATIPATYGVPCALSNWVPIGWPLWPSQDLMICKLFRKKETKQLLSLPEIFERGLAFLQNWSELPSDVEIFANTKEEILDLTNEMLSKLSSNHFSLKKELSKAQKNYAQLAKLHETFASSQFADFFVEKYPDVFSFEESENAEAVKTDCILTAL